MSSRTSSFLLTLPIAALLAPGLAAGPVPKGKSVILTTQADGTATSNSNTDGAVSANGRYVAFLSRSMELVNKPATAMRQVLLLDRDTGVFELASRDFFDGAVNDNCTDVAISDDGRFVVYATYANDIFLGDVSTDLDVFRFDRVSKATERMSVNDALQQADEDANDVDVSADGRYVSFKSKASNLAAGQNGYRQIYVRDNTLDFTRMISVNFQDQAANYHCDNAQMSADGARFVFDSAATNLGDAQATALHTSIWLRDITADSMTLLSKPQNSAVDDPNGYSTSPAISPDGRYVVFSSTATNLLPNDPFTSDYGLFLFDVKKAKLTRLDLDLPGLTEASFDDLSLSKNGRYLSFRSAETSQYGGSAGLGIYDRKKHKLTAITKSTAGTLEDDDDDFRGPRITPNGKYVVYWSPSTKLDPNANATPDVFLYRR